MTKKIRGINVHNVNKVRRGAGLPPFQGTSTGQGSNSQGSSTSQGQGSGGGPKLTPKPAGNKHK